MLLPSARDRVLALPSSCSLGPNFQTKQARPKSSEPRSCNSGKFMARWEILESSGLEDVQLPLFVLHP